MVLMNMAVNQDVPAFMWNKGYCLLINDEESHSFLLLFRLC